MVRKSQPRKEQQGQVHVKVEVTAYTKGASAEGDNIFPFNLVQVYNTKQLF